MNKNIVKKLSVADFCKNYGKELQLELLNDESGEESYIKEPTINRPGLALAGFFLVVQIQYQK